MSDAPVWALQALVFLTVLELSNGPLTVLHEGCHILAATAFGREWRLIYAPPWQFFVPLVPNPAQVATRPRASRVPPHEAIATSLAPLLLWLPAAGIVAGIGGMHLGPLATAAVAAVVVALAAVGYPSAGDRMVAHYALWRARFDATALEPPRRNHGFAEGLPTPGPRVRGGAL